MLNIFCNSRCRKAVVSIRNVIALLAFFNGFPDLGNWGCLVTWLQISLNLRTLFLLRSFSSIPYQHNALCIPPD